MYFITRKSIQSGVCFKSGVASQFRKPGVSAFLFLKSFFKARLTSFSGGMETVRFTANLRNLGDNPKRAVSTAPGAMTVMPTPSGLNSYQRDFEKL